MVTYDPSKPTERESDAERQLRLKVEAVMADPALYKQLMETREAGGVSMTRSGKFYETTEAQDVGVVDDRDAAAEPPVEEEDTDEPPAEEPAEPAPEEPPAEPAPGQN